MNKKATRKTGMKRKTFDARRTMREKSGNNRNKEATERYAEPLTKERESNKRRGTRRKTLGDRSTSRKKRRMETTETRRRRP